MIHLEKKIKFKALAKKKTKCLFSFNDLFIIYLLYENLYFIFTFNLYVLSFLLYIFIIYIYFPNKNIIEIYFTQEWQLRQHIRGLTTIEI